MYIVSVFGLPSRCSGPQISRNSLRNNPSIRATRAPRLILPLRLMSKGSGSVRDQASRVQHQDPASLSMGTASVSKDGFSTTKEPSGLRALALLGEHGGLVTGIAQCYTLGQCDMCWMPCGKQPCREPAWRERGGRALRDGRGGGRIFWLSRSLCRPPYRRPAWVWVPSVGGGRKWRLSWSERVRFCVYHIHQMCVSTMHVCGGGGVWFGLVRPRVLGATTGPPPHAHGVQCPGSLDRRPRHAVSFLWGWGGVAALCSSPVVGVLCPCCAGVHRCRPRRMVPPGIGHHPQASVCVKGEGGLLYCQLAILHGLLVQRHICERLRNIPRSVCRPFSVCVCAHVSAVPG